MSSLLMYLIGQAPAQATGDIANQALTFIHSIAHYIGQGIVEVLRTILPSLENLETIVDPIGFLALLTIFIILVTVVRKVTWVIIIAGWLLIGVRISLMLFGAI